MLRPANNVSVAIGFDLANVIAIETSDGLVIVDTSMTMQRAMAARDALFTRDAGPVRAIIYTHGHLDHVGGAAAFAEQDTAIWGTERLARDFYRRYGTLLPAERSRAERQFGRDLGDGCAGLGPSPDLGAPGPLGALLPTHTFRDQRELIVGSERIVLVEAPGETEDQLFVWLPERAILLCGDNWYPAFPNLYTIRGTSPRPVDDWIASIDAMRALDPEILVPSHTAPIVGRDAVREVLRDHRDAIQYVRDEVIRSANRGERIDPLAERMVLPPHLAAKPALAEIYGQLDWSARGLYGGMLGWFDGRATELYPLPHDDLARRSIAAMGGEEKVRSEARATRTTEPRWSAHLLSLLEDARASDTRDASLDEDLALTYEALAATIDNANGRNYLLQSAHERRAQPKPSPPPELGDAFVDGLPLPMLFEILASRLRASEALDVYESVVFDITEQGRQQQFVVTVRRGVAEVIHGAPLPDTPAPVARLATDARTWRQLATNQISAVRAVASGQLTVEGSPIALSAFLDRFERGLGSGPAVLP